jgi:hypothetical protein
MREMTLEEMAMVTGGYYDNVEEIVVTGKKWESASVGGKVMIGLSAQDIANLNQEGVAKISVDDEITVTAPVKIKNGVDISNLSNEIFVGILWAQDIFAKYHIELVVTSANDGKHMLGSKHFTNNAFDLRANNMTDEQQKKIAAELQEKLGSDYYVGAEFFANGSNDHIHVEYDPR